jgi:hypothetical protein
VRPRKEAKGDERCRDGTRTGRATTPNAEARTLNRKFRIACNRSGAV